MPDGKGSGTIARMTFISKQDALVALAAKGLMAVEHPEGPVQTPGGGKTDWPTVAGLFLRRRPAVPQVQEIVDKVDAWNERVGSFTAESWEPTRISIMDALTGRVVASCELTDEDALIDAVLTVISGPRPG